MTTENAFAAGQSGNPNNVLAPQSETAALDTTNQTVEEQPEPGADEPEEEQPDPGADESGEEHPDTDEPEDNATDEPHHVTKPEASDDDGLPDDETLRRHAAGRLSEQLDIAAGLGATCEHLAELPMRERIEAVFAAARVMQATSQLGRSLAQLLKIERRQLSIVQHVQPAPPTSNHSNASGEADAAMIDDMLSKFFRYMKIYADEELGPVLERSARKENGHDKKTSDAAA